MHLAGNGAIAMEISVGGGGSATIDISAGLALSFPQQSWIFPFSVSGEEHWQIRQNEACR